MNSPEDDPRPLLTVSEAAVQLGISPRALGYRLQRGTMHGVKVNPRLWLLPHAEVAAWQARGSDGARRKPPPIQRDIPAPAPELEPDADGVPEAPVYFYRVRLYDDAEDDA